MKSRDFSAWQTGLTGKLDGQCALKKVVNGQIAYTIPRKILDPPSYIPHSKSTLLSPIVH